MIYLGWILLVGFALWALLHARNPWIARIEPAKGDSIRLLDFALSAVFGLICVVGLLIEAQRSEQGASLWIFGAGLVGSSLHGWGVLQWTGRTALLKRVLGWMMLAGSMASAGTLALTAPIVAIMGLGLGLVEDPRPSEIASGACDS